MKVTRGVYIKLVCDHQTMLRFHEDIVNRNLPLPLTGLGGGPRDDGSAYGSWVFHDGDMHVVDTWIADERCARILADVPVRRRASRPTMKKKASRA